MNELEEFKKEIEQIKQRNARVEADKAWETSLFRKVLIAILIYTVLVLFFFVAKFPNPFISAIVPTVGFILSTLSIPFFKNLWLRHQNNKK